MAIVNRLSVDGRDYFLPDPVTELKNKILEAIKAGGGYVNIPPLRSGPGIDIGGDTDVVATPDTVTATDDFDGL